MAAYRACESVCGGWMRFISYMIGNLCLGGKGKDLGLGELSLGEPGTDCGKEDG